MIAEICFHSLLYILFCVIIIFPPDEIAGMGLTVEKLLGSWLGSEMMMFVQYHQRRTAATLFIHTLLIPGYVVLLLKSQPWLWEWLAETSSTVCASVVFISLAPVAVALCTILWWNTNNWSKHPISRCLERFVEAPQAAQPQSWIAIAVEINIQYRRVDKLSTRISSNSRLVVTDNWLIEVGAYRMRAMPLSDALLVLEGAITNNLDVRPTGGAGPQLLKLRARCVSKKIEDIAFRLPATLLEELDRKLVIPLLNSGRVVVKKSLADQFHEVFINTVNENPPFVDDTQAHAAEPCIGCMVESANVKLDRRCQRVEVLGGAVGEGRCLACSCRPMWCVACLSKWFAARQDQGRPETWLSSRAPCPTCRSPFCLLDVRLVAPDNQ